MLGGRRWQWAGGLCVLAQLILILAQARVIVRSIASNADFASALSIGHDAALYPGSTLVAGNYAWWNGMWATQLLDKLPLGTLTTNYGPLLGTLVVVGALAWAARRIYGETAGLVAASLLLGVGIVALAADAAWSARALTWWAMVGAGLAATAVSAAPGRRRSLSLVAVVVWGGAALAGDQLVWVAVVAPLAAAAGAHALARAWRPARALALATVGVPAAALVIHALAHAAGYRYIPLPLTIVPFDRIDDGVANTLIAATRLWTPGGPGDLPVALGYLGAIAVAIALWTGLRALHGKHGGAADERTWTVFWTVALAGFLTAFALTRGADPIGQPTERYLHGVPFAVAALLAAAVGRRRLRRGPVVVLACAAGLVSCVSTAADGWTEAPALHRAELSRITGLIDRYDLDLGYASYWSAAPMEHATDYRYRFLPVDQCFQFKLCIPSLHSISGAYRPRPGVRTFLLVDTTIGGDGYVTQTGSLRPEAAETVAPGLTMLIFPYDLARQIEPNDASRQR